MNTASNTPDRRALSAEAKQYLSVGGIPAQDFDVISSSGPKTALRTLLTLFAAGVITQEALGRELERIVVANTSGSLKSIIVNDGVVSVGVAVPGSEYNVAFTNNRLASGSGDYYTGKVAFRDTKNLNETSSVLSNEAGCLSAHSENDTFAVCEIDTVNGGRVKLMFKDGSTQEISPQPKEASGQQPVVWGLNFAPNGDLYTTTSTKAGMILQRFSKTGENQYSETGGVPTTEVGESITVQNGKVIVVSMGGNTISIYNEYDLQAEPIVITDPTFSIQSTFGIRPGTNEFWFCPGMDVRSVDITNPAEVKTVISSDTIDSLVPNVGGMLIGSFSTVNPNVLHLYTNKSSGAQYMMTFVLNSDGTASDQSKTNLGWDGIRSVANAPDMDKDAINNFDDNCPAIPNNSQVDTDLNGVGDACENPTNLSSQLQDQYDNLSGQVEEASGHTIYGNAQTTETEDAVIVTMPSDTESTAVIINNDKSEKDAIISIPPNTDWTIEVEEGSLDNASTEISPDYPQSENPYQGTTDENGVELAVSGTHIVISVKPATTVAEETQTEQVESPAEYNEIIEEVTPENQEVVDEVAEVEVEVAQEVAEEAIQETVETAETQETESKPETTEITPEKLEEIAQETAKEIADETANETGKDTIETDTITIEESGGGGGGCAINMQAGVNAGLELAMLGAALILARTAGQVRASVRSVLNRVRK